MSPAETHRVVIASERVNRRWSIHTAWRVQQFDREQKHFKSLDHYIDEKRQQAKVIKAQQSPDDLFASFAALAAVDLSYHRRKRDRARQGLPPEEEGPDTVRAPAMADASDDDDTGEG